jgi:hypothetical protein
MANYYYCSCEELERFMSGFAAALELAIRAGENGFMIETICLSANVIDGLLRIGIALRHQLSTERNEIPAFLINQDEGDEIVSERQIYKLALENRVIQEPMFEKLERLYRLRNRVVHRYVISGLTTKDILNIGIEYEQARGEVSEAIELLEAEQVAKGVGMTRLDTKDRKEIRRDLKGLSELKHGDGVLARALKKNPSSE